MKSLQRKVSPIALGVLALLFVTGNSLRHRENPFYYEDTRVTTLVKEDGSLIKKLNRAHCSQLFNRRNFIPAVHDEWEMDLGWYESLKRSIFGKSDSELQMEQHFLQQARASKNAQYRKTLLKQSIQEVKNYQNIDYTLDIYVGSDMQPLTVSVDTGSSWLVLASTQNKETSGAKFNISTSSTYQQMTDEESILIFGNGWVRGIMAQDQVYFNSEKTLGVEQMDFFLAHDSNNLNPDSGLIGFSRNVAKNVSNSTTKQPRVSTQTFLTKLHTQNQTLPNIFSLFLGQGDNNQSFIEIGSSNVNMYSNAPAQAAILALNESIYWETVITGFSVGDYVDHSFALKDVPVIFDTGSEVIFTPASMGTFLINQVLKGRYAWQSEGFYFTECDYSVIGGAPQTQTEPQSMMEDGEQEEQPQSNSTSTTTSTPLPVQDTRKFMPVYIHIQGYWMQIPPSSYLIPLSTLPAGQCLLGFAPNTQETFVLGNTFLSNYYSVFDNDAGLVTVAPILGASFNYIDLGEVPERYFTVWDNPNVNAPVFSLMGTIMLLGAAFAILTKMGIVQKLIDKASVQRKIIEDADKPSHTNSGQRSNNVNRTQKESTLSEGSGKSGSKQVVAPKKIHVQGHDIEEMGMIKKLLQASSLDGQAPKYLVIQ